MCYYINIIAIIILTNNWNIHLIYPFLHGPFIFYSLFFKDKFMPTDLSKTTSFALHTFGTIVTNRVYWKSNFALSIQNLNFEEMKYLYPNNQCHMPH